MECVSLGLMLTNPADLACPGPGFKDKLSSGSLSVQAVGEPRNSRGQSGAEAGVGHSSKPLLVVPSLPCHRLSDLLKHLPVSTIPTAHLPSSETPKNPS